MNYNITTERDLLTPVLKKSILVFRFLYFISGLKKLFVFRKLLLPKDCKMFLVIGEVDAAY